MGLETPQQLGIILEHFPGPMENIIAREIELLEQMGYSICVFIPHPMPDDGKRLGFNAGIFFDTRPPSALILAGIMAVMHLALRHPRRLLTGCAAFLRLPQLRFGERQRWHAFFYALSLAGTHIYPGKVTKLFSFSAGNSATIAMLAGLFSGIDFNFNVVAQDIATQPPA